MYILNKNNGSETVEILSIVNVSGGGNIVLNLTKQIQVHINSARYLHRRDMVVILKLHIYVI